MATHSVRRHLRVEIAAYDAMIRRFTPGYETMLEVIAAGRGLRGRVHLARENDCRGGRTDGMSTGCLHVGRDCHRGLPSRSNLCAHRTPSGERASRGTSVSRSHTELSLHGLKRFINQLRHEVTNVSVLEVFQYILHLLRPRGSNRNCQAQGFRNALKPRVTRSFK